jgi:hypothetical protein
MVYCVDVCMAQVEEEKAPPLKGRKAKQAAAAEAALLTGIGRCAGVA